MRMFCCCPKAYETDHPLHELRFRTYSNNSGGIEHPGFGPHFETHPEPVFSPEEREALDEEGIEIMDFPLLPKDN